MGSLLGGVVNLWRPESLWVVGGLTIVGIVSLVLASVQLVRESLLCLEVLRDHAAKIDSESQPVEAPAKGKQSECIEP